MLWITQPVPHKITGGLGAQELSSAIRQATYRSQATMRVAPSLPQRRKPSVTAMKNQHGKNKNK